MRPSGPPRSSSYWEAVAPCSFIISRQAALSELHRQVFVEAGDQSSEVDEELAPLFALLWSAGVRTVFSCQCHPPTGKVWIGFESGRDAELFLAMVLEGGPDDDWTRAERWFFSAYDTEAKAVAPPLIPALHPADWEFFASVRDAGATDPPSVRIGIDILFPKRDLPLVIERVGHSLGRT